MKLTFDQKKWEEISDDFDSIVFGNGLSISISPDFRYDSLFDHAVSSGWINDGARDLFEHLKTKNFEEALRVLSDSNDVVHIIEGSRREGLDCAHQKIKESLISSIGGLHKRYESVVDKIDRLAKEIKKFKYVFCLNYDLLMYWAVVEANKIQKNRVKDCFVAGGFSENWQKMEVPYKGNDKSTLVFYPHGNMAIFRFGDSDIKVSAKGHDLLSEIGCRIGDGASITFVSEGTSSKKLESIVRSNYLKKVYFECMGKVGSNLVIHGWSMSDNDQHLVDRIVMSGALNRVAVGVNKIDMDKIDAWKVRLEKSLKKHLLDVHVTFYEASQFLA